jgi:hypothetical protein
MYPHRIRLLGPWECEPLAPPLPPCRFVPPARLRDAGLADIVGVVRLTRRFGYPGRIDSYEHVWLTFAEIAGSADITLNDHAVASAVTGTAEFEITPLLASRNRLDVVLCADSDAAGLPGEIALEVRRDAFLRQVAAHADSDGAVHVTGRVCGSSVRPLEVYLLADGQHAAYSLVAADRPVALTFRMDRVPQTVRVELVCVAECWHAAEVPVGPSRDRQGAG